MRHWHFAPAKEREKRGWDGEKELAFSDCFSSSK